MAPIAIHNAEERQQKVETNVKQGPNEVTASIKFMKWIPLYETEKPFQILIDLPEDAADKRHNNLAFEWQEQTFRNFRGQDFKSFNLDDHGFTFRKQHFNFDNYTDQGAVERDYFPQLEKFLRREVDGVDRVFFFDWRLRHAGAFSEGTAIDLNDPTDWLLPSLHAHIDPTPSAILNRIRKQLPDEAEDLLKCRVRWITAWKPLRNPVADWPLAVADGSNVTYDDLIETDHIRRQYIGGTMNARYKPDKYKWHYLHEQTADEVILLKQFDSKNGVKAKFTPHVAFPLENVKEGTPRRESIEVRALVFTRPKGTES